MGCPFAWTIVVSLSAIVAFREVSGLGCAERRSSLQRRAHYRDNLHRPSSRTSTSGRNEDTECCESSWWWDQTAAPRSLSTQKSSELLQTVGKVSALLVALSPMVSSAVASNAVTASNTEQSFSGLGVDSEGLLALCPSPEDSPLGLLGLGGTGCVSSQDDRPQVFLPPWCYDGSFERSREKLIEAILAIPGAQVLSGDSEHAASNDRYIRVSFQTELDRPESIDDTEFYFTPNDSTVQFRSIRRGKQGDFGSNQKRLEALRIALRFENVPILRNRRRTLLFIESPFDTFGPPTIEFDKSIDDLSGEMKASPLLRKPKTDTSGMGGVSGVRGDLDPFAPVWEGPSRSASSTPSSSSDGLGGVIRRP